MDTLIEKLSIPVTHTETESMDVDGMDDVFFCGGIEEDDDIIITVNVEKAMHEMVQNVTIKTKTQQQQSRRSHQMWWFSIIECAIPFIQCGGIQNK